MAAIAISCCTCWLLTNPQLMESSNVACAWEESETKAMIAVNIVFLMVVLLSERKSLITIVLAKVDVT